MLFAELEDKVLLTGEIMSIFPHSRRKSNSPRRQQKPSFRVKIFGRCLSAVWHTGCSWTLLKVLPAEKQEDQGPLCSICALDFFWTVHLFHGCPFTGLLLYSSHCMHHAILQSTKRHWQDIKPIKPAALHIQHNCVPVTGPIFPLITQQSFQKFLTHSHTHCHVPASVTVFQD